MNRVDAWCDGSALGNPGAGGWAWWCADSTWRCAGTPGPVTNNRMELAALRDLLAHAPQGVALRIHLDSRYTLDAVTKWCHGWARNGWKTKDGKPVANEDAIRHILELMRGRDIDWVWVRGHDGNEGNETVDRKARAAATRSRELGENIIHGPGWGLGQTGGETP